MEKSIHDFRKWFSEQNDLNHFFNTQKESSSPYDKFVGKRAKSKVGESKLLERVETEDDIHVIVESFLTSGGTVVGIDGKNLQIETKEGIFLVPRFCVKVRKS